MLLRLLVVLSILYLAWRLLRYVLARSGRQQSQSAKSKGSGGSQRLQVQGVRCAYCGLFLPEPEAVRVGEQYFCNQEHQQAQRQREQSR